MKRLLCLMMISATSFGALAQEVNTPSAVASRQEASRESEERYKIMAADIETLNANNQALQEKISSLRAEVEKLHEEQARAANLAANSGVRDDLKHLAEKIQEVDRKRESDKQVISEEIKKAIDKLGSAIKESAPAPAPRTRTHKDVETTAPVPAAATADKGFAYTVQGGDTLPSIAKKFNAEFKSKGMKTITRQQVKDANPNINFDKLRSGQKLIIPDPSSLN